MTINVFSIGKHVIGKGNAFIIAEVAQAHDGSLGTAHAYIDLPSGEIDSSSLIKRLDIEITNTDYDVIGISSAFVNNHRWVKLAAEYSRRCNPNRIQIDVE